MEHAPIDSVLWLDAGNSVLGGPKLADTIMRELRTIATTAADLSVRLDACKEIRALAFDRPRTSRVRRTVNRMARRSEWSQYVGDRGLVGGEQIIDVLPTSAPRLDC